MTARIAAVTMVYNEPDYLPVWIRHHAGMVGAAHCHVIDHGSDDGSTAALGAVNVLRLPRSPQDDPRRARFLSSFCGALLGYYDAVLHSDVDELTVLDGAGGLADYAAAAPDVVTAIGFDLHHLPDEEPPIDPAAPIGRQRRWVRFASSMCKPVLIRRPVVWAPGFHCADAAPVFDRLILLHLRYWDLARGLRRLAKTRAMPWAIEGAGGHQRVDDAAWSGLMRAVAALPRRDGVSLHHADPPLAAWLDRVRGSMRGREHDEYRLDLHISGDELWALPERLRARI